MVRRFAVIQTVKALALLLAATPALADEAGRIDLGLRLGTSVASGVPANDMPGYGIHGTPIPEQVGRTESHGCFRLANWNAEYLLKLVGVGTPVWVEP